MNECRNCKGQGYTLDTRYAGVSHKRTEYRHTCRICGGTGCVHPTQPDDAPQEIGELPDWMTGEEF